MDGWSTDRRYLSKDGQPASLPITGARRSFESLVKDFAGDVPYMAVLRELRRMRAVQESNGSVRLANILGYPARTLAKSLKSMLPIVADGIGLISSSQSSGDSPPVFRLTLKAMDSRDLAIMRHRAVTGAGAFINGLDRSLHRGTDPSRKPVKSKHSVTVTVLVREQETRTRNRR